MENSSSGSSRSDGVPPPQGAPRDPVYVLPRSPPVVGGNVTNPPIQAQQMVKTARSREGQYYMEAEPPSPAQYSMSGWPSIYMQSFMSSAPQSHLQNTLNAGLPVLLQDPYSTYPYINGQEYLPSPICWPPLTPHALAWPPMQYQPALAYPNGMYPTYPLLQVPLVPSNARINYEAEYNGCNNIETPRLFSNAVLTSQLPNSTCVKIRAENSKGNNTNCIKPDNDLTSKSDLPDISTLKLRKFDNSDDHQDSLDEYLKCRMPVTSQAPHTSAMNRPEGFVTVVPRKLFITRPLKWGWNFTAARLGEIVMSSIERMYNFDRETIPDEMLQAAIEHIDVPRHSNNRYKGYAIITFKSMKAAYEAFKALTFDDYFHYRHDIFQQDIPYRYVTTVLYAAGFPSNFSKDFTLRLVESCIPSTLGRLTHDGVLIHDCILAFDFPTNLDGTCEGRACITFGFEEVAYTVRTALYYRGFLVSFSPIPHGKHGLSKVPVVHNPPPYPSFDRRGSLSPRPPNPQMGIFPPTPPMIAHPAPCLSDKRSAQLFAKRSKGKAVKFSSRSRDGVSCEGESPLQRKIIVPSEIKPRPEFDYAGSSVSDPTPTELDPFPDGPGFLPDHPEYELSSPSNLPVIVPDKLLAKRGRTMSL